MNWRCFTSFFLKLWSFSSAFGINISTLDSECDHIDHESETVDANVQLLQLSNVLFRDAASSVSAVESDGVEDQKRWNFTEILKDEPKGSFLSHLDVLVQLVGLTYNTTSPISPSVQAPSNVTTRDGIWKRLSNFDRDPYPGGVFARVFRKDQVLILVFKGICTDIFVEQCQIDLCYLKEIRHYGPVSDKVLDLMGFDSQVCNKYKGFLNFTEQALLFVKQIRHAFPRCQLILTGHSLGGMLAMTVAQMLPSSSRVKDVKALAFAPAPWNHLQPNLEVKSHPHLVALCDPYDCGINAFFAPGARLPATTCLFLEQEEPKACQGLVEPYKNHTWREQLEKHQPDGDFLIPLLVCKGSAHRWSHYETMVEVAAHSRKFPQCRHDFSVL